MPFLCASFCQGLCFRRSEARVAQPARAHQGTCGYCAYNLVRDIEYGQNSMSEIKTLAQKMDIGRYGKLGTLGSQNFRRLRRAKSGFHYRGVFRYTYSERHPEDEWIISPGSGYPAMPVAPRRALPISRAGGRPKGGGRGRH